MKRQKSLLKGIEEVSENIIFSFRKVLFKNKDIISGEELAEAGIVSEKTEGRLAELKKLRKLNNIYYVWDYNSEFKRLIFSYKYDRKKSLAKLIAKLIREELQFVLKREKIDFIVSVPINRKRENERGYNQVDEILEKLDVNYIKIRRIRNTEKMHKLLNEKLREENIKGSFKVDSRMNFSGKKILLVDDIVTTGATLREIKKSILNNNNTLNEKGKTEIIVFCLAAAREIKLNRGEI